MIAIVANEQIEAARHRLAEWALNAAGHPKLQPHPYSQAKRAQMIEDIQLLLRVTEPGEVVDAEIEQPHEPVKRAHEHHAQVSRRRSGFWQIECPECASEWGNYDDSDETKPHNRLNIAAMRHNVWDDERAGDELSMIRGDYGQLQISEAALVALDRGGLTHPYHLTRMLAERHPDKLFEMSGDLVRRTHTLHWETQR